MRIPDPKANTTTEAYLAYKAGYLEESELKPVLYEPYLHFDAWLAYWAGLTSTYPVKNVGKNLFDKNHVYDGWINDTGVLEPNDVWQFSEYIPVLPNTAYTVSCSRKEGSTGAFQLRYASYTNADESSFVENYGVNRVETLTYTTPSTCHYIRVGYRKDQQENIQLEEGSTATSYEPYTGEPEMLTDEEALVAYLSGVTDTYPEEIKDPYDVRIVGYLKYLVSAKWGRPDYPVNNEEFYLSTMKPPVVPSGDTPSSDIEMDDTAEAPFIDLKMYGDTRQNSYTGKNLSPYPYYSGSSSVARGITFTAELDGSITINGSNDGTGNSAYFIYNNDTSPLQLEAGTYYFIPPSDANVGYVMFDGTNYYDFSNANNYSQTFSSAKSIHLIYVQVRRGNTTVFNNLKIYPMLTTLPNQTESDYEPYVGGVPAPNPDYPQEIQTVTGEQTVAVDGKNLFPTVSQTSSSTGITIARNSDGTYNISGTATSEFNAISWVEDLSAFENGQTYTLSVSEQVGDLLVLVDMYNGSAWLRSFPRPGGTTLSQTAALDLTNATKIKFSLRVKSGKTVDLTNLAVQFEKGAATDFVPYQNQSYTINLGKNILNNNSPDLVAGTATWTPTDTGGRISNSVAWGDGVQWRFKGLSVGGKYTFHAEVGATKCYVYVRTYTDGSFSTVKTRLVSDATGDITRTITLDSPYVAIMLLNNIPMDNVEIKNFQFELGDAFTGYAPYFEPIELCKIGDYQDYIYKSDDEWYIHKEVGKEVNNGTRAFSFRVVTDTINSAEFSFPEMVNHNPQVYSTHFRWVNQDNANAGVHIYTYWGASGIKYYLPNTIATTKEEWKAWLETNPDIFYYPLATYTDTQITNPALIAQLDALVEGGSYEDKTFIKVTATDPNLPGLLYVEAGKNV